MLSLSKVFVVGAGFCLRTWRAKSPSGAFCALAKETVRMATKAVVVKKIAMRFMFTILFSSSGAQTPEQPEIVLRGGCCASGFLALRQKSSDRAFQVLGLGRDIGSKLAGQIGILVLGKLLRIAGDRHERIA